MESPWLSGRASERRIWRSEVGFLMGTQNFFIFFHLGPMLVTRWKISFFISLPSSKLTISLISIYKHYAIDIADPSSMLDACHTNFVIDLAHRGVSVARCRASEHRIQSLRFDSLWGLRIFSFIFSFVPHLCRDEKHLPLFPYQAQNLLSLLFLSSNITLSTLLILAVCWTHVIWTLW